MVEQVRRFNRTVTQRVGALDDHFLARDRPLGEARVLWEIGPDGCEVRALRARLGLDSGHASRLLRALEADGMVRVAAGRARPPRARRAAHAPRACAELALLDERSEELAASLLAPLTPGAARAAGRRDARRRAAADRRDGRDPSRSTPSTRTRASACAPTSPSSSAAPARPFDPLVGSTAEPHELRPPAGEMVVAYLRDEPVGCGALKHFDGGGDRHQAHVARRGGARARPRAAAARRRSSSAPRTPARAPCGSRRATSLVEAIALYRSAGYREVPAFNDEPFAHHWFEKRLGVRAIP